jgi:hypothetical protein
VLGVGAERGGVFEKCGVVLCWWFVCVWMWAGLVGDGGLGGWDGGWGLCCGWRGGFLCLVFI